jgi:hypothetical protein
MCSREMGTLMPYDMQGAAVTPGGLPGLNACALIRYKVRMFNSLAVVNEYGSRFKETAHLSMFFRV